MKPLNLIPNFSEEDKIKFWARVDIKNREECWNWLGTRVSPTRYVQIWKDGHSFMVHRVTWYLHYRRQPGNFLICHHCDNPICCNPYHLFIGSSIDNARDMCQKGRHVNNQGENHGLSTLKTDDVLKIRQLYDLGYSQKNIAQQFGINQGTVSRLIHRLRWKHL